MLRIHGIVAWVIPINQNSIVFQERNQFNNINPQYFNYVGIFTGFSCFVFFNSFRNPCWSFEYSFSFVSGASSANIGSDIGADHPKLNSTPILIVALAGHVAFDVVFTNVTIDCNNITLAFTSLIKRSFCCLPFMLLVRSFWTILTLFILAAIACGWNLVLITAVQSLL